ncbi:Os10g0388100 [Oryza sativa Japonica Group]|uniref:Os10g0388100 protein n=1 Tax=Oryza sativa subsp. japonica TaxID=39947 RepID=A0A0P0XTJ4_ORYSJ|nr:hypothetical protein EE612_051129 [Oryza sativa]BAT10644.1 Os10g0388100 [Oryza sativa Japonica Group]
MLMKKSNTLAWEICLTSVQVQRLMRCGRASQFDPATDKLCKQQIKLPIG